LLILGRLAAFYLGEKLHLFLLNDRHQKVWPGFEREDIVGHLRIMGEKVPKPPIPVASS
jgi:hypothetical protein